MTSQTDRSDPLGIEMDAGNPAEPVAATAGRFSLRAVGIVVVLVALAVPFGLLLLLVRSQWGPLRSVDSGAVTGLHQTAVEHPLFVQAMKAASFVGSAPFYWALAVALIIWLLRRSVTRRAALGSLFVVVAIGGGQLLNVTVKDLVHRVRPALPDPVAHAGGLSFPSGHAQAAMIGYGVLVLVIAPQLARRWRIVLVAAAAAAALTIGFSRVALGVHYPSDVLGGYLLGAVWLTALLAAFGRTLRPSDGIAKADAAGSDSPQ